MQLQCPKPIPLPRARVRVWKFPRGERHGNAGNGHAASHSIGERIPLGRGFWRAMISLFCRRRRCWCSGGLGVKVMVLLLPEHLDPFPRRRIYPMQRGGGSGVFQGSGTCLVFQS